MRGKLFWFLFGALFVYTVKSIFVGADIDEAYGVTVGYRLVQGDKLMWDMWEPHQTSAIFTALFIRMILLCTKGSLQYLTVSLRVCFFVVQAGIAFYLYKCLKDCLPCLSDDECALFGMIYYITTPKCIYVPEYSNLHVWFSTLLALYLMQFFGSASRHSGRYLYLVWAGAMLACDVLAYPSMVIFYPICVLVILRRTGQETGRSPWIAAAAFTLPCVVGVGIFLGYVFCYMNLADIMTVLPYIMTDGSHKLTATEKWMLVGNGLGELLFITVGCAFVAAAIAYGCKRWREKRGKETGRFFVDFLFFWFLAQTVYQIIYWLYTEYNSGYPQAAYLVIGLFGLLCHIKSESRNRIGSYLVGLSLLNYVGLNLFSNWKPTSLTVYLVLGLLGGLLCWRAYFLEKCPAHALRLIRTICVVFVLSEVFGRCFLVIGGDTDSNRIYQVRGFNRDGVRGGILASYMNAYRYNNNYELFPEIVPAGSNVLYLGPSQFYYMMGDCRIAAPSTISTPEYDEHLQMYYELHPEKFPDVVVVESLYGDVSYFGEDNYIYTWLEEEFAPYEMEDYPYVRVYRRAGDE
ncbi:MAG: hypothetical protein IJ747_09035 [Lachnospiraceae bacterium]|nr:hypothetical protein [Lachnospiraceae bacterium]